VKVVFSQRGRTEATRADAFWRAHHPGSSDLLTDELVNVISLLETRGVKLGRLYAVRRGRTIYRVLLEKSEHHLYYRREANNVITVLSMWAARRPRPPKL
jgi:hypothetical protein